MAIGKQDLARAACKLSEMQIPFKQMEDALDAIAAAVRDLVKEGNEVIFGNVGRFQPVIKPAGTARNPQTGEDVEVPDRVMLKFRVNSNFKVALRDLDASTFRKGEDGGSGSPVEEAPKARPAADSKTASKGRRR